MLEFSYRTRVELIMKSFCSSVRTECAIEMFRRILDKDFYCDNIKGTKYAS